MPGPIVSPARVPVIEAFPMIPPLGIGDDAEGHPHPIEVLWEDGEHLYCRPWRRYDGARQEVLAVLCAPERSTAAGNARLLHEFELRELLDRAWALRPLELVHERGQLVLLVEYPGGERLDRFMGHPMDVGEFLRLSIALAAALSRLHGRGLVHKDIKPTNFVVDPTGSRAWLTGFGIASRLPRERQSPEPPELIAGTLPYMAPEQTGRMNRSIDSRSDLYALGVTFYQMLTGSLPFEASDPMEWIHCHVAKTPVRPNERVESVPAPISAIVMKLLAKTPEERYQTAAGLEIDLRKSLLEWNHWQAIADFALGARDRPDRLVIPQILYGREREVELLLAAFERLAARGAPELLLVSGSSGVGKSSTVHELQKAVARSSGRFAAGKFEQFKRNTPYASIAQAFQVLVRQLLTSNDLELARWRGELSATLGPNARLMVDLVPDLSLVIGAQPPAPDIEPQDAQARFNRVFRNLLGVFAKPEHPLILFIDDLQWIDTATLELLQYLLTEPHVSHLLVIGAYRDNEVDATHPLSLILARISSAGARVSKIHLEPLRVLHVAQLLADVLHTPVAQVQSLAELIVEKTGGSPFFTIQFLRELGEEQLLGFDAGRAGWLWDLHRIRSKSISDNVADLMATRLGRLSVELRTTLARLACLGNVVETNRFAAACGSSEQQVNDTLQEAVDAGLLLRGAKSFAFCHDRIYEAAYNLLSQSERTAAHLAFARALLAQTAPNALEAAIFDIVDQFDRARTLIDDPIERIEVARLTLRAGERAKASSAYADARRYFASARALLAGDLWDVHYRLLFTLERNLAECEFVAGEITAAQQRIDLLLPRAISLTDRAEVVGLAMRLYFNTAQYDLAIDLGLDYLRHAGMPLAMQPSELEIEHEYERLRLILARHPIETLVELPAITDADTTATIEVLCHLMPVGVVTRRSLGDFVLLRLITLSLENGHCDASTFAYAASSIVLGPRFRAHTTGYMLGQLACDLIDRRGIGIRFKSRVYTAFGSQGMPWKKPFAECQPLLRLAFDIGSAMGDRAMHAYSLRGLVTNLLIAGRPLAEVQTEAQHAVDSVRAGKLFVQAEQFFGQLRLIRALRGIDQYVAPGAGEAVSQRIDEQAGVAQMLSYYWVFELQERFLAGDYSAAAAAMSVAASIRWAMRSFLEEAEYDFYSALTHAALCDRASNNEIEPHRAALAEHYRRIELYAGNCSQNFADRNALVLAELARLDNRPLDAERHYEDAIRLAHEQGFVQNEAIAYELAARFYSVRGFARFADVYLREARRCYERWGASAIVARLDAAYPHLRASAASSVFASTIETRVAQLDAEAVAKMSQTLSSEMNLPSLIETLMHLAVEHAGAQRALLVLFHGDVPYVEAVAGPERERVEVVVRRARLEPTDLPQSVLHYALRTRERVLLDDAAGPDMEADEYIKEHRPKSVLCLPIFKHARVTGVLYLENKLTARAFTSGRVALLDVLASQAAISLENARLYSDLHLSEALLAEAQRLSLTGSFLWRVTTDEILWSKETHRIFAHDPAEPVTLDLIASRFHPDDIPLMGHCIARGRAAVAELDYEFRLLLPDKSVKHLHLFAYGSVDAQGRMDYIGAIQDITARRASEEEIATARAELARVARISSLGQLTASIAHELNSPLAGILTNASTCLEVLGDETPDMNDARSTVQRITRDAHRAVNVIKRLRALFTGQPVANELVDLNEAIREVIALSLGELNRSHVMLRMELAEALPCIVGDRIQLQQVVLNLLLNARDAMVDIVDRARELLITTDANDGSHVHVSVKDVGTGLDENVAGKMFQAFYSTKIDGMGIGLSVSRSIIESHGGRIWGTRNVGPGATFSFSIPHQNV